MIARHCRNIKIASLFLLLFPCKLILISTASKRIFRFFKADKSHCFQTQKQGQNAANSVIKQAKKRPGTQVGICVPGLGHGSIFLSFGAGVPIITASRGSQPALPSVHSANHFISTRSHSSPPTCRLSCGSKSCRYTSLHRRYSSLIGAC